MLKEAIIRLVAGESLSEIEAAGAMEEIMTGEATASQMGSFLTALRMKGETIEEIAGLARVMRAKALPVQVEGPLVDTCGTGGDGANTFNISTTAAFVVAGAGARVAKHGNRAASSRCGSADVLEALGVKINLNPQQVAHCIEKAGIGFMFAQAFHPAMKHIAPVRREIGIRTVFNILGPLCNPAGAAHQVLGVANGQIAGKMAAVLKLLGSKHVLVVHSDDGLDEISLNAPTQIYDVRAEDTHENLVPQEIKPADYGFHKAPLDAIAGGTAAENAEIIREVLQGKRGPHRDIVLLNAAAALVAIDRVADLQAGVTLATDVLTSGAAYEALNRLIQASQESSLVLA